MTLGDLIEDLQQLAEEHGKEIEIDINIEADPMSTMNIADAVAHNLDNTAFWIKTDTRMGKDSRNLLSLHFS